jgi:hypothetical protein
VAKNKAAISAHPLFPAIVALWFAALLGLGSLVLPPVLFERAVTVTRIDSLLPMAAPPLGLTARLLIALAAAVVGAAIGVSLARRITAANRPVRTATGQAQARREYEERQSAKIRKPISAKEELRCETLAEPEEDGLPRPAPIPGRRRALAMQEDGGPSEYLQAVPLPGGEMDFGQIAAEVTATISDAGADPDVIAPAPAEQTHEDDALDLEQFVERQEPFEEQIVEETLSALRNQEPEADLAEPVVPVEQRQEFVPAAPLAEIEAQATEPMTFSKSAEIIATEASPETSQEPEPVPDSAPFAPPPAETASEPQLREFAEPPAAFADPVTDAEAEEVAEVQSFAPPVAPAPFADPVAAAIEEAEIVEPAEEPLVFSAPSLHRQPQAEPEETSETQADKESETDIVLPAFKPLALDLSLSDIPLPDVAEDSQLAAQPDEAEEDAGPPLSDLDIVGLAERLNRSLQRRLKQKALPIEAAEMNSSVEAKTFVEQPAQPFSMPQAFEPEDDELDEAILEDEELEESLQFAASEAPPAPVIPAALRPIELIFEEDLDAEEEALELGFPLMRKSSTSEGRPQFAAPELDEEEEAEDPDSVAENESYSSLLAMKSPFRPTEEFVRIEEPEEDFGEVEPAVVFPGSEPKPVAPEAELPAFAQPAKTEARPFANPSANGVTKLPPRPRTANDRAQAEQALRSALATLQRISGAA